MGKSKHESFSSIGKSNFQLLKAKFKENGFKKHSEKGEENGQKEEKEKKRSWWKWLSSVRGHWSCQGSHSNQKKTEMIVTNSLEANNDLKVSSNPTVTDIVEIPTEPEKKISEILIKPTKTEIKAMIAQYRGSSAYSERPAGDQLSISNNFSYEIKTLERNGKKFKEKSGKTDRKRLSWNTEVFENNTDTAKNTESLLTSALFIHQDMDKIVESAVFIEPHLPNDYVDSNKFDEISQKSLKISKTGVSYKVLDEKNDRILKTFKTVSEPTWDERKKILRQQRLQDNINNLLEQFILLEVEDVIDFPLQQNKLPESNKKVEFSENSYLNSREPLTNQLSGKVSPEVLVNIKPFKEYVSEDYSDVKESSMELILKNHIFESKDHMMKRETKEVLEKSEITFKNEKVFEETIFPVLKCAATSTKKNDSGFVAKDSCGVTERDLFLSSVKKDFKNNSYESCAEQILDFVSDRPNKDLKPVTPCTVWGLYRSYSTCTTNLIDEKEGEQEKENQQSKNTLDEVLDNLDDSNHDVIFQKNISQFRRKINMMPRLDDKKTVVYSEKTEATKVNLKNAQKSKKSAKFMQPCKTGLEKMKAVSLKLSSKKKIEIFRFGCSDLWKHGQKQEKILENIFLQLSESKMIFRPRIEATRIEVRTITFLQTLREMHDILESNNFTVMEIEMPINFEKNFKNVELLWMGNSETLRWSDKPSIDVKKYVTVAVVLSFQGQDFDGKFCTTENDVGKLGKHILQSSKFFPKTSECFYLVQNQLLIDYEQKSNLNTLNINEVFNSTCLENSKKTEDDKEKLTLITAGVKHVLKFYEPVYDTHFGCVEILSISLYEYVARIYDWVFFYLDTSSKSWPESNVLKSNMNSPHSASAPSTLNNCTPTLKEIPSSEFIDQQRKKTTDSVNEKKSNSDIRFDGFQILYNNSKEILDDEEEYIRMVFAKQLLEKSSRSAILSNNKTLDRGKELQDNNEEEEAEGRKKKKNVYSKEEFDIFRSLKSKISRTLTYKSKSSPREMIHQAEVCCYEHRTRRSLSLTKETEKDLHSCKKRRLSFDVDAEIRKTESGSGSFESRIPPLVKESSYVQKKSSFGMKDASKSLVFPFELKTPLESEFKSVESKKTYALEKSGMNVRKEIVAAFNSIKELNKCKGETKGRHKRMSVVIMLSKK